MVLERLLDRKPPIAQLDLGDRFPDKFMGMRSTIEDFIRLSQEKPNLAIVINTDALEGYPIPGPTLHDFMHYVGWSKETKGKKLSFSEEQDWFSFAVTDDEQKNEQLIILVNKNSSLLELQFEVIPTDRQTLSGSEIKLKKDKQRILSEKLKKDCMFPVNQRVFADSLNRVLQEARQLALVA